MNGSDQTVPSPWHGLNVDGVLCVVTQCFSQLPDGVRQHLLGDVAAAPNLLNDLALRDDVVRVLSEVGQNLHRLGLDPDLLVIPDDPVQIGLNEPVTDTKIAIQLPFTPSGIGWSARSTLRPVLDEHSEHPQHSCKPYATAPAIFIMAQRARLNAPNRLTDRHPERGHSSPAFLV